MSCSKTLQDLKIAEKVAQDAYDEAKKQDDDAKAALDLATQQGADEEKKRDAGFIPFEISGAGLVCRCRIPTAAVAQLGVFRILLGGNNTIVSDAVAKIEPESRLLFSWNKTAANDVPMVVVDPLLSSDIYSYDTGSFNY